MHNSSFETQLEAFAEMLTPFGGSSGISMISMMEDRRVDSENADPQPGRGTRRLDRPEHLLLAFSLQDDRDGHLDWLDIK